MAFQGGVIIEGTQKDPEKLKYFYSRPFRGWVGLVGTHKEN